MPRFVKKTGLIVGGLALVGVAACSNKPQPTADAALKGDLELVSSANKPQVVVSALEAGPTSAPAPAPRAVPKAPPRPVTHATPKTPARAPAPAPTPAPAPAPAPVQQAPVIQAPAPQPAETPAPAPARAPREDGRVYKTEGQIFKQMPWIRP